MKRRIAFWFGWWLGLTGLWLLLVWTLEAQEIVAAVVGGAIGATAAAVAQAQGLVRFSPRWRWLGGAWRLPLGVLTDTWLVFVALYRRFVHDKPIQGVFRTVPFAHDEQDDVASARVTLATFAISLTPNTYVVGADEERDILYIHQLVPVEIDERPRRPLEPL
jgi:multisubunit Na+/H+ antiporter MnhE subunit